MASFTTFYLSRILGLSVHDYQGNYLGKVTDIFLPNENPETQDSPQITGIVLKKQNQKFYYYFNGFSVHKKDGKLKIKANKIESIEDFDAEKYIFLKDAILDKQIVDINGRKLVRVNDIRLIFMQEKAFTIAVDVGMEGLLRRIGIAKQTKKMLSFLNKKMPTDFILWEDVAAIDTSHNNITLSKTYSKIHKLHPSDIADIIEEMGNKSLSEVFSSLDEEKAADVLEELEPETQKQILENLPIEKMADVLEKMPADEVADILDEISEEKAELLLNEMEKETSEEVRELMEYEEDTVGSIMNTDFYAFDKKKILSDILSEIKNEKPEAAALYSLYVLNSKGQLSGSFSLRDLIVADEKISVEQIMKPPPAFLYDTQDMREVAETLSKYNMLSIPVIDDNRQLIGTVVIDDVVEDLIHKRKTNK